MQLHGCFAEQITDVEYAETAYFEKVTDQRRTGAFQYFRSDMFQIDDVVGNQPVAARDEFQRQFALADACVALDEHAGAEHFEKYAMDRGALGQTLCQVMPQVGHQNRARQVRGEQRGFGFFRTVAQHRRYIFPIGNNNGRKFGRKQVSDGVLQAGGRQAAQVVHFGTAQHLHPVGVDEVQVADERKRGLLDGFGGQTALPAVVAGDPVQVKLLRHVAEQGLDGNMGEIVHALCGAPNWTMH